MCGIIGYVGRREAAPILLGGLQKLEYRGYDSSGLGVISADQKLVLRKMPGKIQNLHQLIKTHPLPSATTGISHTRWATHGVPSRVNAHPHQDCHNKFLVVHNGIIENYEELKRNLTAQGHRFVSQTDTEVIPHLVEKYYQGDLLAAVRAAIRELRGAFAIGVICSDHPDQIVAARVGSPLIIGLGRGENYIASDVPAILDLTKRIIYLNNGEIALLKADSVEITTFIGKPVKPKVDTVTFSVDAVQKQGYAHFMLKEIHEQPAVLDQMCRAHLRDNHVEIEGLGLTPAQLKAVQKIVIVACGTAYHAGLVGRYFIEQVVGIPVVVDVSSEFRYRDPILDKKTLVIAISQSGETADTLAAVREAKQKGARVVAICNVVGSSLAREADGVLYTHAGPEIGVASTKAYTAQIALVFLFALRLCELKESLDKAARLALIKEFKTISGLYQEVLNSKQLVARIAKKNSHFGCFLFLGRNINYPSALEGALKLKEISYIPAEGYAAGEMKHGPIALIDEYRAVVCISPQSEIYDKMISNMQEIRARKGHIIAIATRGDKTIAQHAQQVIFVPPTSILLSPLVTALPLQLLAYYIAVQRDCDVDQPRNLAKSVTVE